MNNIEENYEIQNEFQKKDQNEDIQEETKLII